MADRRIGRVAIPEKPTGNPILLLRDAALEAGLPSILLVDMWHWPGAIPREFTARGDDGEPHPYELVSYLGRPTVMATYTEIEVSDGNSNRG